jgi:two-component system sensor histidine kinase KdpD
MERFRFPSARRVAVAVAAMVAALAATTLVVALLEGPLGVPNASATYLLAVVAMALAFGTPAAVGTALGSLLVYDVVFVEPTGALSVASPEEWLNLLLLLALGVIVGQLAGLQRSRAEAALLRERQARAQYRVGRALATSATASALPEVVGILQSETGAARAWVSLGPESALERVVADSAPGSGFPVGSSHSVLRRDPGDQPTDWARVHEPRLATPGHGHELEGYRVPIVAGGAEYGSLWVARTRAAGRPGRGDTRVLAAAADQVGQALERDRLAQEATSAEVARRSEAAKTALLDSVSHDLRTPLATIRAAAGSLMDPALDEAADVRHERAAVIDREAERLNRLVANLLDMSRIESGDLKARLEPFPLEDLVETTLNRMSELLDGHAVTVTMPADLPLVAVDPVFVDQVLTNLLENAARHAPREVPIRVGAIARPDETVRLTIEDGGPGVPDASLGLLFEKFSRVRRAGDRSRPGSGIGLAVVRGLVLAMGGSVAARPSELGGLAVDVDLRAATPPWDVAGVGERPEAAS